MYCDLALSFDYRLGEILALRARHRYFTLNIFYCHIYAYKYKIQVYYLHYKIRQKGLATSAYHISYGHSLKNKLQELMAR